MLFSLIRDRVMKNCEEDLIAEPWKVSFQQHYWNDWMALLEYFIISFSTKRTKNRGLLAMHAGKGMDNSILHPHF